MATNHPKELPTGSATPLEQAQVSPEMPPLGDKEHIAALRDRIVDLEVELIVVEAAIRSQAGSDFNNVDRAYIVAAAAALPAAAFGSIPSGHSDDQPEHLTAAIAALELWLEPSPQPDAVTGVRRMRLVLACGALAVSVAAGLVHLAYALLLIPIGGIMSWLRWGNQDQQWRRVGAERRFAETRIQPPAVWSEDAVRSHQQTLRQRLHRQSQPIPPATAAPIGETSVHPDAITAAEAFAALGLCATTIDAATTAALQNNAQHYRLSEALQTARDEWREAINRRDSLPPKQ